MPHLALRQWFSNGGTRPPGGGGGGVVRCQGGRKRQGRTRRSSSTGYASALYYVSRSSAELIGFTFTLVCVNFQQVHCTACLLCSALDCRSWTEQTCSRHAGPLYIWQMPEHDTASQLNFAPSRQEVKH